MKYKNLGYVAEPPYYYVRSNILGIRIAHGISCETRMFHHGELLAKITRADGCFARVSFSRRSLPVLMKELASE